MTKRSITDDLRSKLGAAEGRQLELNAELAEISYAAHVETDAKAVKRLKEISAELAHIGTEIKSITAALEETARRERVAELAELAKRQRADAEKAAEVMADAERLAELMDTAMRNLHRHAADYQQAMAKVRSLSGAGPQQEALRSLLSRAIKTGLTGLPQYPDLLQPHERRTVTEITTAWAQQVRNKINSVIETAKAA